MSKKKLDAVFGVQAGDDISNPTKAMTVAQTTVGVDKLDDIYKRLLRQESGAKKIISDDELKVAALSLISKSNVDLDSAITLILNDLEEGCNPKLYDSLSNLLKVRLQIAREIRTFNSESTAFIPYAKSAVGNIPKGDTAAYEQETEQMMNGRDMLAALS